MSVFAKRATAVELLLFDRSRTTSRRGSIELVGDAHRTGAYWHAFVPGIGAGQAYAIPGPRAVGAGAWPAVRRGPDSCSTRTAVASPIPDGYRRTPGSRASMAGPDAMKSVVVDLATYDWEGDRPLDRPFAETVIYEAHVKGFTANPNSGVDPARRGTYAGFIEKIPYLVDLGDHRRRAAAGVRVRSPRTRRATGPTTGATSRSRSSRPTGATQPARRAGARSTSSATSSRRSTGPGSRSSSTSSTTTRPRAATTARRSAIAASPTSSTTSSTAPIGPATRTSRGTGNTLNANESIVRRMILDSLRYWVVGDARRRLPVRPRVGALARRGR